MTLFGGGNVKLCQSHYLIAPASDHTVVAVSSSGPHVVQGIYARPHKGIVVDTDSCRLSLMAFLPLR